MVYSAWDAVMQSKQNNVRLPAAVSEAIGKAVKERGFPSASAFVRHAIEQELGRGEELANTEARITATLDRYAREMRGLHDAQQANFAYLDALVRVFLMCVPEPPSDIADATRTKAKARYENFLRNVARSMSGGETKATLGEMTNSSGATHA